MSPAQERKFKPEYAKELLRIAESDVACAEIICRELSKNKSSNLRSSNAFYHVQQCIEKSLKAVLVANHLSVPLVHELGTLVAKLPDSIPKHFGYEISQLSEFATIRRYEEGEVELSAEEIQEGLRLANSILVWAQNACKAI